MQCRLDFFGISKKVPGSYVNWSEDALLYVWEEGKKSNIYVFCFVFLYFLGEANIKIVYDMCLEKLLFADKFPYILCRVFSGVSGASQQHHLLPGPDSYTPLQSDRKPTADHPLAEKRCPCGPGAGTDNNS